MNHIKALDSIRALALFGVIISHWLSDAPLLGVFNPGQLGVNTFFVLSGFLITGILFQNRAQAELAGKSSGSKLLYAPEPANLPHLLFDHLHFAGF
jgi:peptidoglycan/LPS O-acetylase OafA/YrhL